MNPHSLLPRNTSSMAAWLRTEVFTRIRQSPESTQEMEMQKYWRNVFADRARQPRDRCARSKEGTHETINFSAMRAIMSVLFLGITAAPGLALAASGIPPLMAERWVNSTPLTADVLRGKV